MPSSRAAVRPAPGRLQGAARPPRRRLVRAAAVACAATAVLTTAGAGTALGHAAVKSRTPAPGSTHAAVRSVRITFGEAIVTGKISLATASGKAVAAKASGLVSGKTALRLVPSATLASGKYVVSWRALADDGHHETGSWSFRVR